MNAGTEILVIDDEQVILDAVTKICTSEGYRVASALDAETGLQLLDTRSFGLILCDVMMPKMDGFAFLKLSLRKAPDTPVIMATGFSTVETAVQALTVGAADYIPKPFTFDELMSAVQRGLRYRTIRQRQQGTGGPPSPDDPIVVPCPPRYRRLGHTSWVSLENDGTARVGVTHLFVRTIEQPVSVEPLAADGEIVQGTVCAQIHTQDGLVHPVLSPISGRIVDTNADLQSFPTIIEKDPYFTGWLYRAIPTDVEYEIARLQPCGSDPLT
jgi:CheY-like chemotaxis protein/glycine cleavage system H lipoate-binding protein